MWIAMPYLSAPNLCALSQKFGQQVYPYDDNFRAVSDYAINNDIGEGKGKHM